MIHLCSMERFIVICALLLQVGLCAAQKEGFGLGVMAGDPTGLSGKYWLSGDRALAFGLAWGVWGRYLHLHGDYTVQNIQLLQEEDATLDLYYGGGLRMRSWSGGRYWRGGRWYEEDRSSVGLGIRLPIGVDLTVDGLPLDVFLEVVPTLELLPGTYLDLDLSVGARYWF
jgi:hypothetical protein